MKSYFGADIDRKLLEAKSEEEVRAIIAETPDAAKLADKIDLVMAELDLIKSNVDEEISDDDLDRVAGGAKRKVIVLTSEGPGCAATFYLQDWVEGTGPSAYCFSNDQCFATNEYEYHHTCNSNCKAGGMHDWRWWNELMLNDHYKVHLICRKCHFDYDQGTDNYNFWN